MALRGLNELRSIAHIIDIHQLTKDPSHLIEPHELPARRGTNGILVLLRHRGPSALVITDNHERPVWMGAPTDRSLLPDSRPGRRR